VEKGKGGEGKGEEGKGRSGKKREGRGGKGKTSGFAPPENFPATPLDVCQPIFRIFRRSMLQ